MATNLWPFKYCIFTKEEFEYRLKIDHQLLNKKFKKSLGVKPHVVVPSSYGSDNSKPNHLPSTPLPPLSPPDGYSPVFAYFVFETSCKFASVEIGLWYKFLQWSFGIRANARSIDPLHKWRLNLNNSTLYILSLVLMFRDKGFFT